MTLLTPEWLILLAVLALAAWYWRYLSLVTPTRIVLAGLLVLILCQPRLSLTSSGLDLWVLMDQSLSVSDTVATQEKEWLNLLKQKQSADDRLHIVDYASSIKRRANINERFDGQRDETRTDFAIRYALSQMDPGRASRLLILSDGFHTEPLDRLAETLNQQSVAVDYRLVQPPSQIDYRFSELKMPTTVDPGQAFLIEATVLGNRDGSVALKVFRGQQLMLEGSVNIVQGKGKVKLTDRISAPGSQHYTLQISHPDDQQPKNDRIDHWLDVSGESSILLISGYQQDPMAQALATHGLPTRVVTEPEKLSPADLNRTRLVIINNVGANRLSSEFLEALPFYVTAQGGGLLMAGGKYSFGSGGYFESAIDPLLPVSMELRNEHKQLAVAMSIVMDRSGSMGFVVDEPTLVTKMDLANDGAARTIELLGDQDSISVIAVDSEPHVIVRQSAVGGDRASLVGAVRRINSAGGGIYVYTGMEAGWEELKRANQGQRHMILFADAADAEEPGSYKALIEEMREAKATVSVIALGTPADTDAELLRDIAERGNGRILFNQDPVQLPALFAQEAVSVARSAFIDKAVAWDSTSGWSQLASEALTWPEAVDGYNLSYLKPEATAAALSQDEYQAPLVAFWQRGQGRVAAVSFPLAGEYSDRVRSWNHYSDFVTTLSRWLQANSAPSGIALKTELQGNTLIIDLLHNDQWNQQVAEKPPVILTQYQNQENVEIVSWEQMKPQHFQARLPIQHGVPIRGAVQLGDEVIRFGPISNSVSNEWAQPSSRVNELKQLATISGGQERVDLTSIWESKNISKSKDVSNYLLMLVLILLILDALLTRVRRLT